MEQAVFTPCDGEPAVEDFFYECEFAVESVGFAGGDFMKNLGGDKTEKRVTFRGYANSELHDALAKAIAKVVDDG